MTKNNNKLTNNHSTFLFIIVVLLIFALITSIVAIILAVKNKKTETFKLKQNNSETTPSGMIISYGGISVLDGYLSCDGKDYKSSDYPELFKVIGTTFGSGDASKSTDFNVPNLINGYLRGDTKSSLSEDQNNYLVKSENIEPLKLNIPDMVYVYSQNSASSFLNFIKIYQTENLWMNTNLMCIGEKTSSILNEIKWKKIFLFNPGEEEFLLYKI